VKIQFYADLHSQIRDDEDAITMELKCSATEFNKVVNIPTRTLLLVTIETDVEVNK
jgi:hypothetical protein